MKSERELIQAVIDDPNIAEKFKTQERERIKICNQCPDKDNCWGCGVWEWWKPEKVAERNANLQGAI